MKDVEDTLETIPQLKSTFSLQAEIDLAIQPLRSENAQLRRFVCHVEISICCAVINCEAHSSMVIGIRPVTQCSLVQALLWSLDVVLCP